jgi:hypothetical protein
MKEFNKGTKPFFHFTSDRYINTLLEWNFRWQKRIFMHFNAYSVSIRFQELKGRLKQISKTSISFSAFSWQIFLKFTVACHIFSELAGSV